jgi:hypothetical protein
LLTVAGVAGLPARLTVVALNWNERNPGTIERFAAANLKQSDWIVSDFKCYYAARHYAGRVFAPTYLGVMTVDERNSITALLIRPQNERTTESAVGGRWQDTGDLLPADVTVVPAGLKMQEFRDESYDLRLYRRIQ